MTCSPFLGPYQPHHTVARYKGNSISSRTLLSHVHFIADQLPHKPYVINLCQDRYSFLIGFAAALCQNQTTLLPPNQSPDSLKQLAHEYPDCYVITDDQEPGLQAESCRLDIDSIPDQPPIDNPKVPDSHIAAIAFTSGTTGIPRPNLKSWGSMVNIAQKTGERLTCAQNDPVTIVATVPHQHMYGLETSIMLPLQRGWRIHSGRPFFPEDIASVLSHESAPRILVSTPIHLRACIMAQSRFPEVTYTLSATAPLSKPLALQVETLFHTTLVEIYGFAEAGTIATKRPVQEDRWTLLSDLTLVSDTQGYGVSTPYFSNPVPIPDTIQSTDLIHFTLEGRPNHLINIGGHRASLDALNGQLLSIAGVIDGTFYMPEGQHESITRLVAFVVAPGLSVEIIMAALRNKIAPVFLPRPMYLVEKLPRNHTGKLVKEDVKKLWLAPQH